jgi:hypothetical protein
VLAGKLTIPLSFLPRQLSTYHTFLLCTAAVQFAFTEMYHCKNSNCNVPKNGSNQHKYFLFGELLKFGCFFHDAYFKNIAQN